MTEEKYFPSLLYYYGLLTMDSIWGDLIKMVIPNLCIKEQYWAFMRNYFQKSSAVDLVSLEKDLQKLAFEGDSLYPSKTPVPFP